MENTNQLSLRILLDSVGECEFEYERGDRCCPQRRVSGDKSSIGKSLGDSVVGKRVFSQAPGEQPLG
jgi:hypothetical protein